MMTNPLQREPELNDITGLQELGTPITSNAPLFSYTNDDATRIMAKASTQGTFLNIPTIDMIKRKCKSDEKHLISLELLVSTLSEYFSVRRIPRGLSTHLRPTLLPHNVDFCKKFEAISNKFSFDILLLNIKYLQLEIEKHKKRTSEGETQLLKMMQAQDLKEYMVL